MIIVPIMSKETQCPISYASQIDQYINAYIENNVEERESNSSQSFDDRSFDSRSVDDRSFDDDSSEFNPSQMDENADSDNESNLSIYSDSESNSDSNSDLDSDLDSNAERELDNELDNETESDRGSINSTNSSRNSAATGSIRKSTRARKSPKFFIDEVTNLQIPSHCSRIYRILKDPTIQKLGGRRVEIAEELLGICQSINKKDGKNPPQIKKTQFRRVKLDHLETWLQEYKKNDNFYNFEEFIKEHSPDIAHIKNLQNQALDFIENEIKIVLLKKLSDMAEKTATFEKIENQVIEVYNSNSIQNLITDIIIESKLRKFWKFTLDSYLTYNSDENIDWNVNSRNQIDQKSAVALCLQIKAFKDYLKDNIEDFITLSRTVTESVNETVNETVSQKQTTALQTSIYSMDCYDLSIVLFHGIADLAKTCVPHPIQISSEKIVIQNLTRAFISSMNPQFCFEQIVCKLLLFENFYDKFHLDKHKTIKSADLAKIGTLLLAGVGFADKKNASQKLQKQYWQETIYNKKSSKTSSQKTDESYLHKSLVKIQSNIKFLNPHNFQFYKLDASEPLTTKYTTLQNLSFTRHISASLNLQNSAIRQTKNIIRNIKQITGPCSLYFLIYNMNDPDICIRKIQELWTRNNTDLQNKIQSIQNNQNDQNNQNNQNGQQSEALEKLNDKLEQNKFHQQNTLILLNIFAEMIKMYLKSFKSNQRISEIQNFQCKLVQQPQISLHPYFMLKYMLVHATVIKSKAYPLSKSLSLNIEQDHIFPFKLDIAFNEFFSHPSDSISLLLTQTSESLTVAQKQFSNIQIDRTSAYKSWKNKVSRVRDIDIVNHHLLAIEQYKNENGFILNHSTGTGKSIVAILMTFYQLNNPFFAAKSSISPLKDRSDLRKPSISSANEQISNSGFNNEEDNKLGDVDKFFYSDHKEYSNIEDPSGSSQTSQNSYALEAKTNEENLLDITNELFENDGPDVDDDIVEESSDETSDKNNSDQDIRSDQPFESDIEQDQITHENANKLASRLDYINSNIQETTASSKSSDQTFAKTDIDTSKSNESSNTRQFKNTELDGRLPPKIIYVTKPGILYQEAFQRFDQFFPKNYINSVTRIDNRSHIAVIDFNALNKINSSPDHFDTRSNQNELKKAQYFYQSAKKWYQEMQKQYGSLARDARDQFDKLFQEKFNLLLIIDEAHKIRNCPIKQKQRSQIWKNLTQLSKWCDKKVFMTATLFWNEPYDIKPLLELIWTQEPIEMKFLSKQDQLDINLNPNPAETQSTRQTTFLQDSSHTSRKWIENASYYSIINAINHSIENSFEGGLFGASDNNQFILKTKFFNLKAIPDIFSNGTFVENTDNYISDIQKYSKVVACNGDSCPDDADNFVRHPVWNLQYDPNSNAIIPFFKNHKRLFDMWVTNLYNSFNPLMKDADRKMRTKFPTLDVEDIKKIGLNGERGFQGNLFANSNESSVLSLYELESNYQTDLANIFVPIASGESETDFNKQYDKLSSVFEVEIHEKKREKKNATSVSGRKLCNLYGLFRMEGKNFNKAIKKFKKNYNSGGIFADADNMNGQNEQFDSEHDAQMFKSASQKSDTSVDQNSDSDVGIVNPSIWQTIGYTDSDYKLCLKVNWFLDYIFETNPGKTLVYAYFQTFSIELLQHAIQQRNLQVPVAKRYQIELIYGKTSGGKSNKDQPKIVNRYNNYVETQQDGQITRITQLGDERIVIIFGPAGNEGLDYKATKNLIVFDPVWTMAELFQIFGRAIRYHSHWHHPRERYNTVFNQIPDARKSKNNQNGHDNLAKNEDLIKLDKLAKLTYLSDLTKSNRKSFVDFDKNSGEIAKAIESNNLAYLETKLASKLIPNVLQTVCIKALYINHQNSNDRIMYEKFALRKRELLQPWESGLEESWTKTSIILEKQLQTQTK